MEKYFVVYNDEKIEFELKRKNVKNINLRVKNDMSITVSCGYKVPIDYIFEFVTKKAPWILKHMSHFKSINSDEICDRKYVSCETLNYLDNKYILKVFESDKNSIKVEEGFIYLFVKNINSYSMRKNVINNWYRSQTLAIFRDSINRMHQLIKKYGIPYPEFKIHAMKRRWGTCYIHQNKIILNSKLIQAQIKCIDYVVMHELTHFKHKNHDKEFYNFMTAIMPDWKDRKKILNEARIMFL